jgi:hypothetical protein
MKDERYASVVVLSKHEVRVMLLFFKFSDDVIACYGSRNDYI